MIQGIDLSAVQGVLDWKRVDPAIKFVIHRCGVGNDKVRGVFSHDGCFDANIAGARATGRTVGVYHFPYPLPVTPGHEDRDPVVQANAHFLASKGVGMHSGELPVVADLEWPAPQDWAKWNVTADTIKLFTLKYLVEMDRLTKRKTAIYIYPDFAHHLGALCQFGDRPLWLASYEKTPAKVSPWTLPDIWQNTGGGGKLYNGAPVDTDVIADDATMTRLTTI